MVKRTVQTRPSSQVCITLDLADEMDALKAFIVTRSVAAPPLSCTDEPFHCGHTQRSTITSSQTPQSESDHLAIENLNDRDAVFAVLFPTILVPAGAFHSTPTRLHVLRALGEGMIGRVYLARDSATSRVFALKVFSKHEVLECEELDNTLRERKFLLETQDNPFVNDLRACFQDDTKLYMVSNFCAGGDLGMEILRWSGKMPMDTTTYIAAHLVEGVASLHALGIIHRDLKPQNVLLTGHGHIKISDFGSATHAASPEEWIEPTATDCFGTPAYHAPEVIVGDLYNCAVDWWCLGIIIYEMVMGEHPFLPGSKKDANVYVDMEDMQESICNGEYTLPKSLDSSTRRIIKGLLRIYPERRYSANQVRDSEFFDGWDWEVVRALKYRVPTPRIVHDCYAASNPDPVFTSASTTTSINIVADSNSKPTYDPQLFKGFEPIFTIGPEITSDTIDLLVTKVPDNSSTCCDSGSEVFQGST